METTLPPLSGLSCPPRYGTPRRPDRPTLGGAVGRAAAMVGTPLMPWQRHVADVALEIDPITGLLAYREVDLTLPRQSGKTALELAVMVHRANGFGVPQTMVYTAQTRLDARRKWEDVHVPQLQRSPLRSLFTVRRQIGQEAVRWDNGSLHGITAAGEKAGHGDTLDLGVVDEAWAHEDARLEQGLRPTMITRPQPQLWVVSTAGTARSAYLRGKVDRGRARAQVGLTDSIAYFEWSAPPEADPADPATWRACMPALGHTVSEATIRGEFEAMELPEFCRAYLNQWPDDLPAGWDVITRDTWEALRDDHSRVNDPVALAADVTPDRSAASIGAAGNRSRVNGPNRGLDLNGLHVEVIDHRPGTGWVVDRVVELNDRHRPCAVVVDPAGPAGSLLADLERAGITVITPTAREAAHAAQSFYDAAEQGALRHLGQAPLSAALAGAQRRPLGDGWAWARKGLSVDISPLVACTLAAWGHATRAHLVRDVFLEWVPYD